MRDQSEETCRYHKDQKARWLCPPCDLNLGECCKPHADRLPDDPECPLCGKSMEDLGAGHLVKPFWRQPHQHFAYPFHRQSLIFLFGLAVFASIIPGGILGFFMTLFMVMAATKYGFRIIEYSSIGYTDPPLVADVFSGDQAAFFRLLGVYFIYGFGFFLAAMTGPLVMLLFVVFASLAFPASIMVLAIEKEVLPAVNPKLLGDLMWRIGWPYLVLWILVFILSAGPPIVMGLAVNILPPALHAGALTFIQMYFYFVIFRHLGYALFQYQQRLGYTAGVQRFDDEGPPDPAEIEPDLALADAGVQIAEGRPEHARTILEKALTRYPDHRKLNIRFERLLASTNNGEALRSHLEGRLKRLVEQRNTGSAVDTWLNYRKLLDGWMPRDSATRHDMAQELARRNKHKAALKLLLSLPKTNPDYEQLPDACLLAARIFEEELDDRPNAERLRKLAQNGFPKPA